MMRLISMLALAVSAAAGAVYDVHAYGAKGDGATQDRAAINKAIEAASEAGGGTVHFGPGTYVTGSIRLRSNITIELERGAVLKASADGSTYDTAEPNAFDKYQDFGHSHWHNSLIWGENLERVAVIGGGLIDGTALVRERGATGDKAIALKQCRNVTLRDFSVLSAGHFAILATGVDNLTIDNLTIDTNRDGIDIDSCRNVRISNSGINTHSDDAITLKGTHALGFAQATENVTITNCMVTGYEVGSVISAKYIPTSAKAPDRDGPTGRIKIGTESEGDFRNIAISNIAFNHSRGLALESVDGAHIEDITVSNITMRDVTNAPFFIRLGSRMRAPEGTQIGSIRRVNIDNVVVYGADPRYASTISGIPGHDVEDVRFSNIRIVTEGGVTLDQVAKQPADLVNTFFFRGTGGVPPREPYATPEREKEYPEPSMFGILPAWGFFIRHAKGVVLNGIEMKTIKADGRPAFVVDDVSDSQFSDMRVQINAGAPSFVLLNVRDFLARTNKGLPDTAVASATRREF